MSGHPLPPGFTEVLAEIRTATDRLIRAAGEVDPEAIHDSIDARGTALDRFTALMDAEGASLSDQDREAIRNEYESLAEQAGEAEKLLNALAESSREARKVFSKGKRAIRTYHQAAVKVPTALDRSG